MTEHRGRLGLAAIALLGLAAVAQQFLESWRPAAPETRASAELSVTSAADRGEGSLREAIFAAASSGARARIVVRVPSIVLRSPLPPLVAPAGTTIDSDTEVEIDAAGAGEAPILDIASPGTRITNLAIVGAAGPAFLVRAPGVTLREARVSRSALGVLVSSEAHDINLERMRFEDNGTGIRIESPPRGAIVRDNRFARHRDAGLWLVAPGERAPDDARRVHVSGNRFEGDRIGIVAGNLAATLERNEIVDARETALHVAGRGVSVLANQVRGGAGVGVLLQDAPGAVVERNEVTRQATLGMLVRGSGSASVQRNRIHGNAYGMAFVLGAAGSPVMVSDNSVLGQRFDGIVVIGDSPVVRRNESIGNGHAGMRVLDFVPVSGAAVKSAPFLEDNRGGGNGQGELVRGLYRAEAPRGAAR